MLIRAGVDLYTNDCGPDGSLSRGDDRYSLGLELLTSEGCKCKPHRCKHDVAVSQPTPRHTRLWEGAHPTFTKKSQYSKGTKVEETDRE